MIRMCTYNFLFTNSNTLTWRFPTFWADGHLDPNLFFFYVQGTLCFILLHHKVSEIEQGSTRSRWFWEVYFPFWIPITSLQVNVTVLQLLLPSLCDTLCLRNHFFLHLAYGLKYNNPHELQWLLLWRRSQWKAWIWAVANSKCFLCCSCVLDLVAKWLQYLQYKKVKSFKRQTVLNLLLL